MLKQRSLRKNIILFLFSIIICCLLFFYCLSSYNQLFSEFENLFSEKKYVMANELILKNKNFNPIRNIYLKEDLAKYFSSYITQLSESYKDNKISDMALLSILSEMERYNVINSKIIDLKKQIPLIQTSNDSFDKGVTSFKEKNMIEAFNYFNNVIPYDTNFSVAMDYKDQCSLAIKNTSLSSASKLVKEKYYSKAISLIEENMPYLKNDKEVLQKLDEYKTEKASYLSAQSSNKNNVANKNSVTKEKPQEKTSSKNESVPTAANIATISQSTINTLNLASATPYLVYVNLLDQKTYIFKGNKNAWQLEKSFLCSTGVKGSDTPKGIFNVQNKGDWFFSEKYNQGAKYWVGFKGNYLFHSYPFDKTKTKVLDDTLGKPSSHGCIRLKTEDAKWLFNNLPTNTKVIIN